MVKNRVGYAAVIAAAIIFIGIYEDKITYIALYSVLLLPVFSIIFALISKRRLDISERLSAETAKKGEAVQYYLTVKNKSSFSYSVMKAVFLSENSSDIRKEREKKGRFKFNSKRISRYNREKNNGYALSVNTSEQFFSLPPCGSGEIIFEITGQRRGIFNVGVSELCFYDPLGLFKLKQKFCISLKLTVMPNSLHISQLPMAQSESSSNVSVSGIFEEDYTDISHLRKYLPSDGYKKIHWKLSAKKNELISKEYQNISADSVLLIVDNTEFASDKIKGDAALRCEDKLIEAAVSIIAHCEEKRTNVYLSYIGSSGSPVYIEPNQNSYAAASSIIFNGQGSFEEFLLNAAHTKNNAERKANVFIFMRDMTDLFCDAVKKLCVSELSRRVVIFYFPVLSEQAKKHKNILHLLAGIHEGEAEKKIASLREAGALFCTLTERTNITEAAANMGIV